MSEFGGEFSTNPDESPSKILDGTKILAKKMEEIVKSGGIIHYTGLGRRDEENSDEIPIAFVLGSKDEEDVMFVGPINNLLPLEFGEREGKIMTRGSGHCVIMGHTGEGDATKKYSVAVYQSTNKETPYSRGYVSEGRHRKVSDIQEAGIALTTFKPSN